MKTFTLLFVLVTGFTMRAQGLANTFWEVYNPYTQYYDNYRFSSGKLSFAGNSSTYTDVALYFENGSNFKIVDLPPPVCANDTGYYTFSNTGDFLDFTLDSDLCSARQNRLANFIWYKAGTVGLNDVSGPGLISLVPNPAGNLVSLYAPALRAGTDFTVVDLLGNELVRGKTEIGPTNISLESLSPGTYFIRLNLPGTKSIKLIKE